MHTKTGKNDEKTVGRLNVQAAFGRVEKQPALCNTRFALMNMKYFLYITAAVFLLSLWVWPQISILILLVLLAAGERNVRRAPLPDAWRKKALQAYKIIGICVLISLVWGVWYMMRRLG